MTSAPFLKPLGLIALALALSACSTREGRIDSGLKKADEFVRKADMDKAGVEVRNVLQIDPKNAPAYVIAARISESQGEVPRAYAQYMKALELSPKLVDAQLGAARLYLITGDLVRARASIQEVLAAEPRQPLARTLQAALKAREGQPEPALAEARAVIAEAGDKTPADTYLLLAGLLSNQRQWNDALAALEAGLKVDPRHPGLVQASVDLAIANPKDAALAAKSVAFFRQATAQAPRNRDLWLAWARLHMARAEADAAEAVLREAVKAQPDDNRRVQALTDFLTGLRGVDVAEAEYRKLIEAKPRDMAARLGLAGLYRNNGRVGEAAKLWQEVVERNADVPSTLSARNQLAAYHLLLGEEAQARAQLAEVLKANPRDGTALVLRGRLALAANQPREAVTDLRAALRDAPGNADILQLLTQAHRAAGEPALAREALADALAARPADAALHLLMAADMADNKEIKPAFAALDNAMKAAPGATAIYDMKAQLALRQKDLALAQQTFEKLKSDRPGEAMGYIRQGQLFSSQKRIEQALKEFDAGAAAAPSDPAPHVAAVGLLTALKRFKEAEERIDTRARAEPRNLLLHQQLRAELASAQGDWPAAEKAYRSAIADTPKAAGLYLGLAKVLMAKGEGAAVPALLADAEKLLPAERALPLARAEWLARLGRNDEAMALYEALHLRFPEDDAVVNNLAYLLAEVKGDPASTQRALSLAGRFAGSRNPVYLDSLGWIHARLGQYDKAVPLLERAVALAPPSPVLQMHLGTALVKSGDSARGREWLKRALDSKAPLPRAEEARALLAQG